jgi:hypothetical protein
MSAKAGSVKFAKATGNFNLVPGVGPYLPHGAAKEFTRPMYRGGPPRPTGVFDAPNVSLPTMLLSEYNNGGLPCSLDFVGTEEDGTAGRP